MRIGLQIPDLTFPGGPTELGAHLGKIARTAEDAGFSSLWVMDHFFQIPPVGPAEHDMLEGYSTLSFLAAHTRRVKLGTLVTGVTYRNPGVLVKTVTTLDVLSGGRAYLGIGAAWFEREHEGLGVPFPRLGERFERLEETIQIAKQMWSQDDGPYRGKHYVLAETLCVPQPVSRPHPPILIGGIGEKKTLRLVAKYADACNLFATIGTDALRHKLAVLDRHCEELGRDPREIERTTLDLVSYGPGGATPTEMIDRLGALARLGVGEAILGFADVHTLRPIELFDREILPRIAAL